MTHCPRNWTGGGAEGAKPKMGGIAPLGAAPDYDSSTTNGAKKVDVFLLNTSD